MHFSAAACALVLCAAPLVQAQQASPADRAQALQSANDDFDREKARLLPLRASEPKRYADVLRALLERHEAQVNKAAGIPPSIGARQSLVREYMELGNLLRFRLAAADEALAAYARASRIRPNDAFDLAALAAADTWRFDKRDPARALVQYRRAAATLSEAAAQDGGNRRMAGALRGWVEHEIAYVEHGRRFVGSVGRNDMALAQLWLLGATMQEPLPSVRNARTLGSLPPSQYQLARVYPVILEFEPAEMLAFFEKHDPAGYLTAALLAAARIHAPSPFVNAAAETFVKSRGIRAGPAAVDPRYATPEKTWAAFIAAAKQGDAARMLDCFTPDMQAKLGELFKRMSVEERRAMGMSFVAFAMQGDSEALIVREHQEKKQAGFVNFENDDGGWKIAGM